MKYADAAPVAADYLKKAIAKIVEHRLPANPINYTLWYNYVSEHLPGLKQEMDRIITQRGMLDNALSEDLFYHHIVNEYTHAQQEALQGLAELANKLLAHLGESMVGSERLDQSLSASLTALENVKSIEDLARIIESVTDITVAVSEANRQFRDELGLAQSEIQSLQAELQQTQHQAHYDKLTQLYNRFAFDRQLAQLLGNPQVAPSVCLLFLDIDYFKKFNDDYGHLMGDRVLERFGELLHTGCPDNALAARYGGEEFAIIVSNASLDEATQLAEEFRRRIQRLRVRFKSSDKVLDNISASIGVAQYTPGEPTEAFIERADQALYQAKRNGRNRVEVAAGVAVKRA